MVDLSKDKIDRLIFSRYLLREAEIQKRKGRPFSSSSILLLHDLVECFLQIALEVYFPSERKARNGILATVADKLNEMLIEKGYPVISSGFIKKLNELRNQLKHSSIFIDQGEIENLFLDTDKFVTTYSKILFDRDLSEFSVTELIKNKKVKENITKAEVAIESGDLENAIISIAVAYIHLERTELIISDEYGDRPLSSIRKPDFQGRAQSRYSMFSYKNPPDSNLNDALKDISKSFGQVHEKIVEIEKAIIYQIDYLNFLRFKSYLPDIPVVRDFQSQGGDYVLLMPDLEQFKKTKRYTVEQVKFCKEFLIDIVLKLSA